MVENSEKLNTQAIDLASKGEFSEAIACFMSALHLDRDNYLLWYNLGVTYRDCGQTEAARKALLKARALNSSDEDVLDTLSLVCYSLGRMDDAFLYSFEALSINSTNAHIWNNLGVFYFAENDYEEAAEAFEQAVSLYPHYVDALVNLRDTYEELGNTIGMEECKSRLKELQLGGGLNNA
ncbi:MAG: tetratricopeptide repeat protein [Treponemataceae bacterium]|nr:tetratricopeptide repeat protein [Treponemataceae bacterium]